MNKLLFFAWIVVIGAVVVLGEDDFRGGSGLSIRRSEHLSKAISMKLIKTAGKILAKRAIIKKAGGKKRRKKAALMLRKAKAVINLALKGRNTVFKKRAYKVLKKSIWKISLKMQKEKKKRRKGKRKGRKGKKLRKKGKRRGKKGKKGKQKSKNEKKPEKEEVVEVKKMPPLAKDSVLSQKDAVEVTKKISERVAEEKGSTTVSSQ